MNILLTTDFSEASYRAIDLTLHLMQKVENVNYFLMYSYQPQAPYGRTPAIPVFSNEAWRKEAEEELQEIVQKLNTKSLVNSEVVVEEGVVHGAIVRSCDKHNIDLVVMGSRQKSLFERMTFGSNALEAVEHVTCPVLIIPREASMKLLKLISIAIDPNEIPRVEQGVDLLEKIRKAYQSEVEVVTVVQDLDQADPDLKKSLGSNLEKLADQIVQEENMRVVDGIIQYVAKHEVDLLVLFPRDRSFLERLVHSSNSKKLTRHAEIPLLLLRSEA